MATVDRMGNIVKERPTPDKMGNLPKYNEGHYKGNPKGMAENNKKTETKIQQRVFPLR